MRKIFGLKREEVTVEWRRIYHEELYELCSSPNFIRVIKSKRKKWAEKAAYMWSGVRSCVQGFGG